VAPNVLKRKSNPSTLSYLFLLIGETWEYDYRYPDGDSTPRIYATGGGDGLGSVNEELEDDSLPSSVPGQGRPSTSPPGVQVNYTTASTTASYETNPAISSLSHDLARTRLNSSLPQDGSPGYGTQQGSMVDDSGIPIPRASQNTPGYTYSMSPTQMQSPFLGSRKTLQMHCLPDPAAD
jgi:hypothetical protein